MQTHNYIKRRPMRACMGFFMPSPPNSYDGLSNLASVSISPTYYVQLFCTSNLVLYLFGLENCRKSNFSCVNFTNILSAPFLYLNIGLILFCVRKLAEKLFFKCGEIDHQLCIKEERERSLCECVSRTLSFTNNNNNVAAF